MTFERCDFNNSQLSVTAEPELRSTVGNIALKECSLGGGVVIGNALLEDITIDNLKAPSRFVTHGAVFHRVTLQGEITGTVTVSDRNFMDDSDHGRQRMQAANAEFYAGVDDWALDITDARFTDEFELESAIPARLLKVDKARQAIVLRERVTRADWQSIDFGLTGWDMHIKRMINLDHEFALLVASESRTQQQELAIIDQLRAMNVID